MSKLYCVNVSHNGLVEKWVAENQSDFMRRCGVDESDNWADELTFDEAVEWYGEDVAASVVCTAEDAPYRIGELEEGRNQSVICAEELRELVAKDE